MLKVMIIGSPGAGKSTFARKLRDSTHLPLYYLDMLWHKPDRTNVSRESFDWQLQEIVQKDRWIIDGNYRRTLETRLKACDTVFLLDFPTEVCLSGAQSRIGKKREDLPWVEPELDPEFKEWIIGFSEEQLPRIYELLEKYEEDKQVIIFKSREEADDYLKYIETRTSVKFYDAVADELLKFAVILTKYNGKWVFCKHKERDTLEVPGGHRELGEKIEVAARRELYEETGALKYEIKPVCVYSVTAPWNFDGKETFGMLYYADVEEFEGELHSEIEKIVLTDELPENWTYPEIQPKLLEEANRRGFC